MSTEPNPLPAYFGWIDAMRGVAAICVVIFHYHHFYMVEATVKLVDVPPLDFPFGAWLWPVYEIGEEAVRLFWVISGFVFAHVYWSNDTTVRRFAVARFARLYPLHLATLLLVVVLQTTSLRLVGHWQIFGDNTVSQFIQHLFLIDHRPHIESPPTFNGPVWSVAAEIFAYVLFFVTLPLTKRRPIFASLLIMIVAFAVLVLRPADFIIPPYSLSCAVFFFAGSAAYGVFRATGGWMPGVMAIIAGLLALLWANAVPGRESVTLLLACVSIVVALAGTEMLIDGRRRIARFLGDISYSIYLVHVPIQMCVLLVADLAFDGTRAFADSTLTLPLYLGVCLGVAYVVHLRFERPVGRWLRGRLIQR